MTPFYARAKDEYFTNTRLLTRLNLNGKLGKTATWQLQNGFAFYQRFRNRYIRDMVNMTEELDKSTGVQDTTRFYDFTFRGNYADKKGKLGYMVGYDVNLEKGVSGKIPDNTDQLQEFAAYASLSYSVLKDKLTFQPALRAALNNLYPAPLIPSFNVLYAPNSKVQLRTSYSKGFRAPSLKELYLYFYDLNHEVEGNRNLKAEQGHHLQLSTSLTVYEKQADFVKLLLTGYYNDIYDQISLYQPDSNRPLYATYTNIARNNNFIISLQSDAQLGNFYTQVGYSITELLNNGSNLSTAMQATATVQYRWQKPRINFSLFYKWFGEQPRLVSTIDGGAAFNGITAPYSFVDASVEKKFWQQRIQLIAGVKNLLDVTNTNVSGSTSGGVHSGGSGSSQNIAAGRSFFTSLRFTLQKDR
ncbi:MAG: TonB-dependent receptor [Sphingobacteriales bacterium]|nr:MAG: TonB-dependent receptor [Sphingobacteriales bacterium]